MALQLFDLKYEFKIEYSGGNGKERWIKFFMEEDAVNSLTMDGLIQRINEKCSFFPSTIKYMDRDKDLTGEDTEFFSDMILSAEAV